MTEQRHDPIFREVNISAEIKRMYGPRWNEPELAYEFSNGRKFYLRTEDAGIYTGAAVGTDGELLTETGDTLTDESGGSLITEISGP
jgi:hypothetical protein